VIDTANGLRLRAIDKATLMGNRGDFAGQRTWLRTFEAIGEMWAANAGDTNPGLGEYSPLRKK
jgi:hypothetical protein